MGQAFDRDGNVLGEAYGETKREVFDKLNAEFAQAHEIRIKTLEDKLRDGRSGGAMSALSPEHPMMRAFAAYKASEAYSNTLKWLTQGSPTGGEGELWAAFETGWRAALSSLETQPA